MNKEVTKLARKLRLSLLLHKPFYAQLRSSRLQQSNLEPVAIQAERSQAEIDDVIDIANAIPEPYIH